MKLKYQLRGLGIGIIVTALLMGVATGKGIPLSDAEVRAKALELGMVERDSLKLTDVVSESPVPAASPEDGESQDRGAAEAGLGDGSGGGVPGADSSGTEVLDESESDPEGGDVSRTDASDGSGDVPETSRQPGTDENLETGASADKGAGSQEGDSGDGGSGSAADGAVRIVIEYGVDSDHVSEMLAEAGLVEDAAAFDSYLCENGFSRSITAGTYDIIPGTSEEEIIRIITKNR